jgi:hypothetical protein
MSGDGWAPPSGARKGAAASDVYDLRAVRGYDALINRSTSVDRHLGHVTCPPALC